MHLFLFICSLYNILVCLSIACKHISYKIGVFEYVLYFTILWLWLSSYKQTYLSQEVSIIGQNNNKSTILLLGCKLDMLGMLYKFTIFRLCFYNIYWTQAFFNSLFSLSGKFIFPRTKGPNATKTIIGRNMKISLILFQVCNMSRQGQRVEKENIWVLLWQHRHPWCAQTLFSNLFFPVWEVCFPKD